MIFCVSFFLPKAVMSFYISKEGDGDGEGDARVMLGFSNSH
jgi:hypothetical protein